ncbi:hypothetical protein GQ44DRAFT_619771 [Phaeosphaeriaceae sp. PMI808]|nr:hypothetical protein GQ44DRAFT_619771 [Phaeosphaeriaceae sp. PMI808]
MDLTQHPPYDTVDFKSLAKKDENFKQIWQQSLGKLDFQNPATIIALSKAILKTDFGLQLELPPDRLCPPIPNRWNYVSWIQNLIDSTSLDYSNTYNPARRVVGLDIGTGASAIYTLLCLQSRPSWTMCATDLDKKSFESAARNLALNNLMTRTKLLQTTERNPLILLQGLGLKYLDFTICNPPFFTDTTDMSSSLKGENKIYKPNAVCTGAQVEMVCPGGDLGFVTKILNESLVLKDKVQWYSSMFGKLDSAKAVVHLLKKHDITNWAVGAIDTGGSTKRWIVAWSFGDLRPRNSIARMGTIANEYLPFPTSYNIQLPSDVSPAAAKEEINSHLDVLDLQWAWNAESSSGVGKASQNVWSRAYRRAYERRKNTGMQGIEEGQTRKVELVFRITVVDLGREVELQWLKGRDQVLWESFCGVMHRHFKKS